MALHGFIREYNPDEEDWTSYKECLHEYFIANDAKTAEKKKAILLSVVGASTYQLIRNLSAPDKPSEKSFDELATLVKSHYKPETLVIVQFIHMSASQKSQ